MRRLRLGRVNAVRLRCHARMVAVGDTGRPEDCLCEEAGMGCLCIVPRKPPPPRTLPRRSSARRAGAGDARPRVRCGRVRQPRGTLRGPDRTAPRCSRAGLDERAGSRSRRPGCCGSQLRYFVRTPRWVAPMTLLLLRPRRRSCAASEAKRSSVAGVTEGRRIASVDRRGTIHESSKAWRRQSDHGLERRSRRSAANSARNAVPGANPPLVALPLHEDHRASALRSDHWHRRGAGSRATTRQLGW